MKFSKANVNELLTLRELPDGRSDHIWWDDDTPGLGVRGRMRLLSGGSGISFSWVVQYRVGAQQRRESLGDVRKVEYVEARKIAKQRFAQARLGVDPGAEKPTSPPFGKVVELYLASRQDRRPETLRQAKHHLRTAWASLHRKPLASIGRAEVAALLEEMKQTRGLTAAARARARLSALCAWAIKRGMLEANVVIGTENPAAEIPTRDRVLEDWELAAILAACGDNTFGWIIQLLVLTGCRADEIAGLRWEEVDLDSGALTIPGLRVKNARTLVLPLPEQALAILRTIPRREGCEFVFPSSRGTKFSSWSTSKASLDTRIARDRGALLNPWRVHDIRRTMRTGLGRLGIPPHVAELVINHTPGGVQAIYDRHKYQPEIKAALVAWAAHVEQIVCGGDRKVVPIGVAHDRLQIGAARNRSPEIAGRPHEGFCPRHADPMAPAS
jgi:integrase